MKQFFLQLAKQRQVARKIAWCNTPMLHLVSQQKIALQVVEFYFFTTLSDHVTPVVYVNYSLLI